MWHAVQESRWWHIAQSFPVAASTPVLEHWPWSFFQFRSWLGGRVTAVSSAWQLWHSLYFFASFWWHATHDAIRWTIGVPGRSPVSLSIPVWHFRQSTSSAAWRPCENLISLDCFARCVQAGSPFSSRNHAIVFSRGTPGTSSRCSWHSMQVAFVGMPARSFLSAPAWHFRQVGPRCSGARRVKGRGGVAAPPPIERKREHDDATPTNARSAAEKSSASARSERIANPDVERPEVVDVIIL